MSNNIHFKASAYKIGRSIVLLIIGFLIASAVTPYYRGTTLIHTISYPTIEQELEYQDLRNSRRNF